MKKQIKNLKWISVFSLIATLSYGQSYDQQTVDFGISTHSLVGVDANSLTFNFGTPTSAGDGYSLTSAAASTNLYYSYMPTGNGNNNTAVVKVQFTNIPQGVDVVLTVDNSGVSSLSSTTYGSVGTVVSGFETTGSGTAVGSSPSSIIENIGASYTGTAYYTLSYTASVNDYSSLEQTSSNGANAPTITYTITN
ncbi:MAG TPA: hypothetical protein DCX14_14015 [Flavobacteriales bacterium]|nr:hypothetical protein [Flavobacteriales bacterium]